MENIETIEENFIKDCYLGRMPDYEVEEKYGIKPGLIHTRKYKVIVKILKNYFESKNAK